MQHSAFSLGALLALLHPVPGFAQELPSPLSPANVEPIVYCPPERLAAGAAHGNHVLNVFLPIGLAPPGGWPVLVTTGYGGGASVPPASTLQSGGASEALWDLVEEGIAVVHFGTPGVGGNRGLWYPPGHSTGRYESFLPAHDNPEKSAEWVVQWVRVQGDFPFDLEHIGMRGSSGGAALAVRTGMGEDAARTVGSAHLRASTRVSAILAIQPPTSSWALEQGPELTIAFPKHFEQAANPGVAASELSQVDPELQKDYSPMRVVFQSPEARANAARQPLCLVYGDPVLRIDDEVASFELDPTGFPLLYDQIKQPQQHDSWFGYSFWHRLTELSAESAEFHAGNSIFAMRDINALAPPLDLHNHTFEGGVFSVRARAIGHEWLVKRLRPRRGARAPALVSGRGGAVQAPLFSGGPAVSESQRLELRPRADGAFDVALRGQPGDLAWLLLGQRETRWERAESGSFALIPFGRLPVVLAPDLHGWSRVRLDWPDGLGDGELSLQACILSPRSGQAWRARLTNVLSPEDRFQR